MAGKGIAGTMLSESMFLDPPTTLMLECCESVFGGTENLLEGSWKVVVHCWPLDRRSQRGGTQKSKRSCPCPRHSS